MLADARCGGKLAVRRVMESPVAMRNSLYCEFSAYCVECQYAIMARIFRHDDTEFALF